MEKHFKSLAFQYDLFVNNAFKLLDTTIEKDYMLKLKKIEELANKINDDEVDKITIKKSLEAVQDECLKLSYKLKTSARLFDEAQVEKEKLIVENNALKSQLEQHSGFKIPKTKERSHSYSNHSDCVQLNQKKSLNNTDALLSDLSYSYSEDSSYENVTKNSKSSFAPEKKFSTRNNILKHLNTKTSEVRNVNINNGGKVITRTTLNIDLGIVNAKSVIKAYPAPISKNTLNSSSSDSVESLSLSSTKSENEFKEKNLNNNCDKSIEKEHNFVQKIIVIPEICEQCHKKIKFNSYMVKCLDCKTVAHLECKDIIPAVCTIDQNKIHALNCGIPPLIVHCISEIEKRGLNTIGLYRVSGSDKEVKNLKDKFQKGIPNLSDVDVHVLCSCLKDFIRMQKNHIISQSHLSKFADALKSNNEVTKSLRQCVIELPSINRKFLAFLILHLQKIASSPKCCMDYNCLAIVFGPTIVGVSSTCLNDLQIQSEVIFKVLTELLKLPKEFWNDMVKIDIISSDEHSTPARDQYEAPGLARRFFSSGLKRRILDSPQKNKIAKQVAFEKKANLVNN